MKYLHKSEKSRKITQWIFSIITFLVLIFGWRYPILGFIVIISIFGGLISAFISGRWFCGNLCPRGGFIDRIFSLYSRNKPAPKWLTSTKFRILVIIFFIFAFTFQLLQQPFSLNYLGFVLWRLCFVTTLFGAILAFFFFPRTWCKICPMGTIQSFIGGKKYSVKYKNIESEKICKKCFRCEKQCPMKIDIISGGKEMKDCIRCGKCVESCPLKILEFKA